MKTSPLPTAFLLFALFPGTSLSITGNELLQRCEHSDSFCLGYIDGATDAQVRKQRSLEIENVDHNWTNWASTIVHGSKYCLRDRVTLGQMRLIFLRYAKEYPQQLDFPAEVTLESALANAFPCPPTKP